MCFNFSNGQLNIDSLGTTLPKIKDNSPIGNATFVFIDSNNLSAEKITADQWVAYNSLKLKRFVPPEFINKTIFLKFTLNNSAEIADTVYFYPGNSFRSITMYKILPSQQLQQLKDES